MKIVEDACQCPGALIDGKRAGAWGDVGVLSFGGSKLLTAGRGGAILTADAGAHQRARLWQNRANVVCPLSELQAAVLLPQLETLDARNARRLEQVRRLNSLGDRADVVPARDGGHSLEITRVEGRRQGADVPVGHPDMRHRPEMAAPKLSVPTEVGQTSRVEAAHRRPPSGSPGPLDLKRF